jgi:hypothetical protein
MNDFYFKQIKEMFEVDQDIRLKSKPGKELPNYLVYTIDIAHNYRLHLLIDQYNYPSKEVIGEEGIKYFNLLILHQYNDVKLQENVLKNVNLELSDKAALIDRIRYNKGEEQLYGTMLNADIEDKENVNKRRKEMGLNSLEEYLKESENNREEISKTEKFDYYKIK